MLSLLGILALAVAVAQAQEPAKTFKQAVMIPLDGTITPMLEQFLFRRLDAAREDGADLVILRIDSPGGLLEESFSIAERMRSIDWARTVAYVPEMALSGAAIASLGCDEIIMHPDARLGDAGPIFLDEGAMFQHAPEKLVSDLAVRMRTLAKSKGRPPALAEAMVDRNGQVFEVTNRQTGELHFLSEAELAALDQPADWDKGKLVLESQKGRFLEVTGDRAVELRLAEATAADVDELKQRFQWSGDLKILEHTWVDSTIYVLNRPWITMLLLIVGLICLYIEFSAPGTAIGGTIAGLCFVLFFWSRVLGGTAGWLEVLLFLTGVSLVLIEVFVVPGFGFTGVTGSVLIVASVVMASQRFVIPRTDYDVNQLLSATSTIIGSGVASLALAFMLRRHFHLIPAFNSLVLAPPEPTDAPGSAASAASSLFELIGQEGVTTTPLRPAGRARFGDQHIDVVAEGTYVSTGAAVRVIEVVGSRVRVSEVT